MKILFSGLNVWIKISRALCSQVVGMWYHCELYLEYVYRGLNIFMCQAQY